MTITRYKVGKTWKSQCFCMIIYRCVKKDGKPLVPVEFDGMMIR
jgi:hypothetical protein